MAADPPLVTCVMATSDRRRFVAQAVRCFLAQDYPATELVVVDDGDDPIGDLLPLDPRVRHLRLPGRRSVGAKRNIAAQAARGSIVLGWDDDDWHGPHRVSAQLAPILAGTADLTGLGAPVFLDARTGTFWECDEPQEQCLFAGLVVGGTLAFPRSWWLASGGFPDISVGEDVHFARVTLSRHARLVPVPTDGHFVCVRHGANTWRFDDDGLSRLPGWHPVPVPAFLPAADRTFYAGLSEVATADRPLPAAARTGVP